MRSIPKSPQTTPPTLRAATPAPISTGLSSPSTPTTQPNTSTISGSPTTCAYPAPRSAQTPPPFLRRTFSGTLLNKRDEEEGDDIDHVQVTSLARQKEQVENELGELTEKLEKLRSELHDITSISVPGKNDNCSTEKQELLEKEIKDATEKLAETEQNKQKTMKKYAALQLEHSKLFEEKKLRMAGAVQSAQKKLDRIGELEKQVADLNGQLADRASLQERVTNLEAREKDLQDRLTQMGNENARLKAKLTKYEEAERAAQKAQKKEESSTKQEERKTIQGLRVRLRETQAALNEAKADIRRQESATEAQRRLLKKERENKQSEIDTAVEDSCAMTAVADAAKGDECIRLAKNMGTILENISKVSTNPETRIFLKDLDKELVKMIEAL